MLIVVFVGDDLVVVLERGVNQIAEIVKTLVLQLLLFYFCYCRIGQDDELSGVPQLKITFIS